MQISIIDLIRGTLVDHYGHQVYQVNNNVLMFEMGIPIAVELQNDTLMLVSILIPFALPDDHDSLRELMRQNSVRTSNCRYGLVDIEGKIKAYQLSWVCEYTDLIDTIERLRAEARRTLVFLSSRQGRNNVCSN